MNLPELITKLLLIERQLTEEGIEVNTVKVNYFNEAAYEYDYSDYFNEIEKIEVKDNNINLS